MDELGGVCAQPWISEKVHRPGYQLLQCCTSVPPLARGGRSYLPEQKQWNLKSFRSAGANVSFSESPGYCRRCRVRGLGRETWDVTSCAHRGSKELVGLQRVGHYWATHTHTHTTPHTHHLLTSACSHFEWLLKDSAFSVLIKCIFVDAVDKIYFS